MQAYPQYQSAIDYIFGATNTFTNGTYESLPNINLVKTASVRSIEMKSDKKLPVPRQRLKEKSRLLPSKAIDIMTQWYDKNYSSPYPSFRECEQMAVDGCISINQVKQWFVNVRRRTQNKNRITRTIDRQVNHLPNPNYLNFYQDISPLQNSGHSNEYKNEETNSQFYPSTPNSYPTFQPSVFQPQYQLPSSSPSYPNYYTPNYSLSPVFTNYTINYINTPLSTPTTLTYPLQSSYNHASSNRFTDSYIVDSKDNSLDYSQSPKTSNLF